MDPKAQIDEQDETADLDGILAGMSDVDLQEYLDWCEESKARALAYQMEVEA